MARTIVTNDNLSPVVSIFIWFFLVIELLTVLIRSVIKRWVIRKFTQDDYIILSSLIFALGQSISISIAATNGLGKKQDLSSQSERTVALKAFYASQLLLLGSFAFSKLGLLVYLRNLSPMTRNRRIANGIAIVIVVWTCTAVVPSLFQCALPSPWQIAEKKCMDLKAFQIYVGIVNIVTDLALIVYPLVVIKPLKIGFRRKLVIGSFFVARILIVVAVVCQLVYAHQALSSTDPLFSMWRPVLCAQTAQALGIVTASTVYLKPFLDSLQSGFLQAGDLRRRQDAGFGYSPEQTVRTSRSGAALSKARAKWGPRSYGSSRSGQYTDIELQRPKPSQQRVPGYSASAEHSQGPEWDATSESHIMQTTTWTIEESS